MPEPARCAPAPAWQADPDTVIGLEASRSADETREADNEIMLGGHCGSDPPPMRTQRTRRPHPGRGGETPPGTRISAKRQTRDANAGGNRVSGASAEFRAMLKPHALDRQLDELARVLVDLLALHSDPCASERSSARLAHGCEVLRTLMERYD